MSNRIAGAFQGVKLMSEEMKRNQFENDWKQVQIADVVKNNEKRTAIKEVRPLPARPPVLSRCAAPVACSLRTLVSCPASLAPSYGSLVVHSMNTGVPEVFRAAARHFPLLQQPGEAFLNQLWEPIVIPLFLIDCYISDF